MRNRVREPARAPGAIHHRGEGLQRRYQGAHVQHPGQAGQNGRRLRHTQGVLRKKRNSCRRRKKAITLGPQITGLRDSITSHLAPDRYIRRSHTAGMTPSAGKLAGQLDERARQKLNAGAGQALRCVNGGVKVVHAGGQSLVIDTVEVQLGSLCLCEP